MNERNIQREVEKARREESELWYNAVCSIVDAETLEKIRAAVHEQKKKRLFDRSGTQNVLGW